MKKIFFGLFIIYFSVGLIILQFELKIIDQAILPKSHHLFYDYRGISHAITNQTIGSKSAINIIEDAKSSKVDFIFFTDLNHFNPGTALYGYHNDVLVFENYKLSYLDQHYLVYRDQSLPRLSHLGHAHAALTDQLSKLPSKEQMITLAHPLKENKMVHSKDIPMGVSGIEIINLRKMWQDRWLKSKLSFAWSILIYPFNPRLALLRLLEFPKKEVLLWDQLLTSRKVSGFLGNNSIAKLLKAGALKIPFPTYTTSFEFASNHVLTRSELTGNAIRDQQKIFTAIANGSFYFSIDYLANPKGFATYIKSADKIIMMGESLNFPKAKTELIVDLPQLPKTPFAVIVFKDGKEYAATTKQHSRFTLKEAGVYRVMVKVIPTLPLPDGKQWFPWIYSNPFYLK